jgi:hypothetical protein
VIAGQSLHAHTRVAASLKGVATLGRGRTILLRGRPLVVPAELHRGMAEVLIGEVAPMPDGTV